MKNRLLAGLPEEEYERLLPHLEKVSLTYKQILYEPNETIEDVYFPNNGIISMLTIMEDGSAIEVGTIGNEAMAGIAVFLGGDRVPIQTFVQVPGDAMRMRADVFKREVPPGSPLHFRLQLYTQAMLTHLAQSAACNRLHCVEERFCRWLLMTQDRVGSDEFPITHEFLSHMLGVRRASVSEVAAIFQKAGIIRYNRGKMTILDRKGLEDAACECYTVVNQEFDRLLGGN